MVSVGSDRGSRGAPAVAQQAIGLVTREVRRAPLVALSVGLQAWERTRGVREFALRRGGEALQIAAHTPLGRFLPEPLVEHDVRAEAGRIATSARKATQATEAAANRPARAAASKQTPAPAPATPPARPAAPPAEAVAAGAPGVATEAVEKVTRQLHLAEPTSRDDLPIPDFDNISIGSLRARLRSLSVEQLVMLREWEQAHANRLPVVTLLDNRIAKVAAADPPAAAYPAEGNAES